MSVRDLIERRASEAPDRPFLRHRGTTLTYGRVRKDARALAAGLHNLGVESGDRVAVLLPNWPEFVTSALAASYLGVTVVPVNPEYSSHELQFVLRNSEASALIAAERLGGEEQMELLERLLLSLPDLQYVVTVGEEDLWYDDRIFQFEDLVSSGEGRALPVVEIDPVDSVYSILYTAGTMGKPKGVMLSHDNLVRTNLATADALEQRMEDIVLIAVPMYHIFGLAALVSALGVGGSVVLMEEFDATRSLELAAAQDVTVLHGVPTMFVLQLRSEALERLDLSTLRTGIVAGAPVSEELVREIRERLVPEIEIAYGLTETSPTVSITRGGDSEEKRVFTVGRLLDGVQARILSDDGSVLPIESIGELAVRGYNVMKGYHRQPEETSRAFTADGFFRTGDLAMLDEEGYLHIVGRKKDTILRGGYAIHPREIEDVLRLHPAVQNAIVLGVENEVLGELTCACILPVEGAIVTEDEIKDFCRGQVTAYKVPDRVRFVESFPMSGSGKVHRAALLRMIDAEGAAGRA